MEEKNIFYQLDYLKKEYIQTKPVNIKEDEISFTNLVMQTLVFLLNELPLLNAINSKKAEELKQLFLDNKINIYCYELLMQELTIIFKNNQKIKLSQIEDIQKCLIDMFFMLYKNPTNKMIKKFQNYIFVSGNENIWMNAFIEKHHFSVQNYWNHALLKHLKIKKYPQKHNVLFPEAYKILGYSMYDLSQMNKEQIALINEEVFQRYQIDTEENRILELRKRVFLPKKPQLQYGFVNLFLLISLLLFGFMIFLFWMNH